jgi:hypothetical protein
MADQEPKATSGLDRRALLRNGLATCFGAAVASVALPAFSSTAQAASLRRSKPAASIRIHSGLAPDVTYSEEGGWAWCSKCQGSFFAYNATTGDCPAGGTHGESPSDFYVMLYNGSGSMSDAQTGWSWCSKCQGMFYGPQQSNSVCPAHGHHDGSGSYKYVLLYGGDWGDQFQEDWAYCEKCKVLFYGYNQPSSVCPAGGQHSDSDSYNYSILVGEGMIQF